MRLKTVSIQNFRLLADAQIPIPSGLTLVNGENGLGKSSIFQAILWCLYGPDALGDNQTSLVRQGHREMSVRIEMDDDLRVVRKFSLAPNGKSGRTELTVLQYGNDHSYGTVAEAQDAINAFIGSRDIFMATAYVDQHDGPGAFLRSKPAEQRQQLRNLLPNSDHWDVWFELAKLKRKTVADRILGNLGRVDAAQEFIDQNTRVKGEYNTYYADVKVFGTKIKRLNLMLEDLQDAQDEVDKVVAENDRRTKALNENKTSLDAATGKHRAAYDERDRLAKLMEDLPALQSKHDAWSPAAKAWDEELERHSQQVNLYIKWSAEWSAVDTQLSELFRYYEDTEETRMLLAGRVREHEQTLENMAPETHCPTCEQKLETDESIDKANSTRTAIALNLTDLALEVLSLNDPVPFEEIRETINAHQDDSLSKPIAPAPRPMFAEEEQFREAKNASIALTTHNQTVTLIEENVNTLEVARDGLPTPDEYDGTAYVARGQTIVTVNFEIQAAETDKRDRERKLAAAEQTLKLVDVNKLMITDLERKTTDDQKLQADLDIVVTGTGPNGARQLMIDQLLGDFQGEVNEWLHVLLPGFSIFMDTQAESGRETFETLFATPTGVIGWHGLSGAQRVGAGLAMRRALASMYAQHTGHTFETWIIDEADGAMRGEKREAFVSMLYKLQESGIDILVVSHADTVVERMEQRIEVVDAGGYTVVR